MATASRTLLVGTLIMLAPLTVGCGSGSEGPDSSGSGGPTASTSTGSTSSTTSTTTTTTTTSSGVSADDYHWGVQSAEPLAVRSSTFQDGDSLPLAQYSRRLGVSGGQDQSPQLSWSGAPAATKSYVITCYDPAAPRGYWHWAVIDLPGSATSLPRGATSVPKPARMLDTTAGTAGYVGAAPPKGTGTHRYRFTVAALDVDRLPLPADARAADVVAAAQSHVVALGGLTATGSHR